ncbi:hypothetical protein BVC80_1707g59 [Macleaya cordata]|uniref:Uncharacterized protein n=1 Tax=Macleaya cordata TaxID=56857 RepID=A0A200Q696_MACCD|nr:hypothetical protein BVC80_1707g59 [Macleaya cordata]
MTFSLLFLLGFTGARQQLLHKLRRFEQLADLDPIELEKRIAQEEEEELEDIEEEQYDDDYEDEDEVFSDSYKGDLFVREVVSVSNLCNVDERIPSDMKRLILDLMDEEEEEECESSNDRETMMMKKLRKRLDSWKEVESNTIDMMVELDFRSDGGEWRKNQEQVRETAVAIEFDIFIYSDVK